MSSGPAWQRGCSVQTEPVFLKGWCDKTPPELLAMKEHIQPFEETGYWELLKKMVNPYEIVYTYDHPEFHPSLAITKPLSRSYFKMIEILDVLRFYEQLPKQQQKIRTAHIAEGPGGFIQAIAETVERHSKHLQVATAMTLRPVDHRVPGWRRASAFLQRNRAVKLHFGADGSGDIYVPENQRSFVEAVAPGAHLFTADGGFDFSVNYQIQEQRVLHLLISSALIGIQSLSTDGSFVLKVFDTYSDATKVFLALLSRHFKEWILYKPALSRPCNSERYFLGRGFRGLQANRLAPLQELFQRSLAGEYPADTAAMTPPELEYITAQADLSTALQLRSLEKALFYSKQPEEWYATQLPKDFATSLTWCQRYRIPTQRLTPAAIVKPLQPISLPFQRRAAPQSQMPDAVSEIPGPCDPACTASSADSVDQTLAQTASPEDEDNPFRTQAVPL